VLQRRAPSLDVVVIPCTVQGASASITIAKAIEIANTFDLCDQLIVTRGGGSIEDLLPFSEEIVLRAILESDIPIITGVGHEIDFALCDFVSDLRAPTPSAAAELASSGIYNLKNKFEELSLIIKTSLDNKISYFEEKISKYDMEYLNSIIISKVDNMYYRCVNASNDIELNMNNKINTYENKFNLAKLEIKTLSPTSILDKGYAIIKNENNKIINSKALLKDNDVINITFKDGDIKAKVGKK
jgi:exodeoxyribonuclease VII large subunit